MGILDALKALFGGAEEKPQSNQNRPADPPTQAETRRNDLELDDNDRDDDEDEDEAAERREYEAMQQEHATHAANLQGAQLNNKDHPLLQPIEGFTLEQHATIVGRMVGGEDLDALVAEYGMDRARYDRVSAGWNQRMSEDPDFVVAGVYGHYFNEANKPKSGDGTPKLDEEGYYDMMYAIEAATIKGLDPQQPLQQAGVAFSDYLYAGKYWSDHFHRIAAAYNSSSLEEDDPAVIKYRAAFAMHERMAAKHAVPVKDQDMVF